MRVGIMTIICCGKCGTERNRYGL